MRGPLLVTVDPITLVVERVFRCFVMPSQGRNLAEGRLVHAEGADGGEGVGVGDVVAVDAVNVGGAIALVQVARVAVVVDPIVEIPPEG